ncbi:MAG: succinate dehydrogenase iron-sulfur subunit [Proteobacteria bacterium]|nr:MAG: succinate dehydrogenase iron-sulfur subunit [Pseudomonadota bacterium]QKK12429.1 MAG: succinate dehydrogenase iron-sulfur subunit [Pseudomonadota bacterium]
MRFSIYRFNPETDTAPHMQDYELEVGPEMMVREALIRIKADDETLSFRHSCGEGVCGSDALNINGRNLLACITPVVSLKEPVQIRPLPLLPVIRDLVVDMEPFFHQYRMARPYLINTTAPPEKERLQSPQERERLDGLYECILCAACSTFCPSWWWNPDKYRGPAALLQTWRFLTDSRDQATDARLDELEGPYKLFRCRTIMHCTDVCPKGLNPAQAIGHIRALMVRQSV